MVYPLFIWIVSIYIYEIVMLKTLYKVSIIRTCFPPKKKITFTNTLFDPWDYYPTFIGKETKVREIK
jgi:hypothetical protein